MEEAECKLAITGNELVVAGEHLISRNGVPCITTRKGEQVEQEWQMDEALQAFVIG